MSKRKRAAAWVTALFIICGLIIWHAVQWHSTGMYLEMFNWIGTDKAYVTVLYNLVLMLGLGAVLGFLIEKITDILGYEVKESRHFDGEAETGKR